MSRLNSKQAPQVIHRLLHTSKLFAGMPQEVRDELSACFGAITFRAGDLVIGSGHEGRTLVVLLEGQAVVLARNGDETLRMATLEGGSMFGEMSFFDAASPRAADVVAVTDGVAAVMEAEEYERLVKEGSQAAEWFERNVLESLAQRIRQTNTTLAQLLEESQGGLLAALVRLFRGGK